MNPEGPYVSVAAICESVLQEQDGKVSCIRFIDVLNVTVNQEQPKTPVTVPIEVRAFVSFKSGPFVGSKNCMLRLVSPSGKTGQLAEDAPKSFPMVFNGGEHGYNLLLTFNLPVRESGLYWFDVLLDEEVCTRIPLKINLMWQSSQAQTGPENSVNSQQTPDAAQPIQQGDRQE